MTVTLRDVCFLHWPIPEADVDELLPSWLAPDVADGTAWITALPMEIARFDVFGLPVRQNVGAVNVRTYVQSPGGQRGVYFLSLDATDRAAVEAAQRLLRLPYYAADVDRTTSEDGITVRSTRNDGSGATLDVTYDPSGATQTASPDTLASFLTERYRYYTEGPLGTRLVGSVGHEPWRLQSARATVREATVLPGPAAQRNVDRPLAHFSAGTTMRIGPPKPLSTENAGR